MDEIRKRREVPWLQFFYPRAVASRTGTILVIVFILFTLSLMLLMSRLPVNTVSSIDPADYNWNRDNHASKQRSNKSLTLCPSVSPLTVGWLDLSNEIPALLEEDDSGSFQDTMNNAGLERGGSYQPKDCKARCKIAVVVPYRNRDDQLRVFLRYMHPFLQRQQRHYTFFIVEQTGYLPFNRGMLLNIGFVEAQRREEFHCFIFHDVDILPEDDRNIYSCPDYGRPLHMSFVIDIHDYKPVSLMFLFGGGVIAISKLDYIRANGYSNLFWGPGLEDDDFYRRIRGFNMTVARPQLPVDYLRYRTLYHDPVGVNPERQRLFDEGYVRFESDGLVNLRYRLIELQMKPLYTHIIVDPLAPYHNSNL